MKSIFYFITQKNESSDDANALSSNISYTRTYHRVIILNIGSLFALQWREFSPALSCAHRLLQCYHRQKRDRRRCNYRRIPPQPPATKFICQWASSLEWEWRHAVTLHILVGKICFSFFLFCCEGMLSLVVLWLCDTYGSLISTSIVMPQKYALFPVTKGASTRSYFCTTLSSLHYVYDLLLHCTRTFVRC